MIEVTPVMDGPDYSGPVEVDLGGLDLTAWSGGSAGRFFSCWMPMQPAYCSVNSATRSK